MPDSQSRAPFFPEIEGMRGVAAGAVLVYHLWAVLGQGRVVIGKIDITTLIANGGIGVDFFFVISGFLLALPWLRGYRASRLPSWRDYARRRLLRLVPAYYAGVVVLAIRPAPPPPGFDPPVVTPAVFLAHLLFVPYLAFAPALNGVYWSLSTEMQFYVILPALALVFARWGKVVGLVSCLAIAVTWRLAILELVPPQMPSLHGVNVAYYLTTVPLPARLDAFAGGIAAASIWSNRRAQPHRWRALIWLSAGLGAIILGVTSSRMRLPEDGSLWGESYLWNGLHLERTLLALGFSLILLAGISGATVLTGLFRAKPVLALGAISYSVYLWHLPVTTTVAAALARTPGADALFLAVVSIMATLGVALPSYFVFERPFMRGGEEFLTLYRRVRGARLRHQSGTSPQQRGRPAT